jgi:DNA-directed RNA polymerase beta' subunit
MQFPARILSRYRVATANDVYSWSFGALKAIRSRDATSWEGTRGTLDDQAIFGPLHDFVCACGKYRGLDHRNMICDICGVKIAASDIRRLRFGHVELAGDVAHPLATSKEMLRAFPILPASFHQSEAGQPLAESYDDLVRANSREDRTATEEAIHRIFDILVPVVIHAHDWDLLDAASLARGLALVSKSGGATVDDRCSSCGYPLGGLGVTHCPGCGKRLLD